MSFLNNVKDDESKKLLLIVEDQQGIIHLLKELFAKDNLLILHTTSGREALELISMKKPDLVLLDMKIPDMDGIELLKSLHKRSLDVKVIVMTAYSELDIVDEAKELGTISFFSKPFDVSKLRLEVLKAIS